MGRRSRARARGSAGSATKLSAPTSDYADAGTGTGTLTLRGSLTAGARADYARTLAGEDASAAATREDSEQRALELLFERLAVRWSVAPHAGAHPQEGRQAGAAIERPRELLARLRAASPSERDWVRQTLREHCAEWFPDVRVP